MPYKPKRPCSYPGCPNLTNGRYCEKHQKLIDRQYEKYGRDPEEKRRYRGNWKKIRDRYIAAHPLCEECLKAGRYTKAEQVHHIVPLSEGGSSRDENLMSLCGECHARIHALRGDRWHDRKNPENRSKS